MHILNEKVNNKLYATRNLELKNLGNDVFMKKYLEKGQLKYNPSSVKE